MDVQLIDGQTGTEIIVWPNGPMNGPGYESATFAGVTYPCSAGNGTNGQQCNEYIEVVGETNRSLVMRAFGYAAGQALVNYSWRRRRTVRKVGMETYSGYRCKCGGVGGYDPGR